MTSDLLGADQLENKSGFNGGRNNHVQHKKAEQLMEKNPSLDRKHELPFGSKSSAI